MPLRYKGEPVDVGYRLDVEVEGVVIVEINSVDRHDPIFEAQVLTYLRLSRLSVGLIINFNARQLRQRRQTPRPVNSVLALLLL